MNGEMYELCCITAAAKEALRNNTDILYTPREYVFRSEFRFLPEGLFGSKVYTASNTEEWFAHCIEKKLQDIKFLTPASVENRNVLGFANASPASLVCFYNYGKVTYFTPHWSFDPKKKWDVLYTENKWRTRSPEKPNFEDNTEEFSEVLEAIGKFAIEIEFEDFADVFKEAQEFLNGRKDFNNCKAGSPPPQLPPKNKQIFAAAATADVFGAMGSWNDSPPFAAHEKGLDAEYDRLSDALLKNIRLAAMYAVNEW